ncbi:hypothetical protein K440DRAFT_591730, partial [Wilcoxina mikolae CBS 423.85]
MYESCFSILSGCYVSTIFLVVTGGCKPYEDFSDATVYQVSEVPASSTAMRVCDRSDKDDNGFTLKHGTERESNTTRE